MSKKDNQKYHAKRRFSQRLGIRFTQYLNDMLMHKIHTNNFKFISRESNRVSIYEITFIPRPQDMMGLEEVKELTVQVVYDKMRKQIVTVGSPGMDLR